MKRCPPQISGDRRRYRVSSNDVLDTSRSTATGAGPAAAPAGVPDAALCADSATDISDAREHTGRVVAICISQVRGTVKHPVASVTLQADHGLVGDAHAGPWPRQVSLLPIESIERVQTVLPDLAHGAFAENIVTENVDFAILEVGDRLQLGRAVLLEITQIGKECHNICAIGQATGDCIMPREGVFCRVVKGGCLHPGDPIKVIDRSPQDQ